MKYVTVIGGDLFALAATQLGSPLQWINIARANNLVDPFLTGRIQLIIPSYSLSFVDGIGPQ